jgi:predicted deacylase
MAGPEEESYSFPLPDQVQQETLLYSAIPLSSSSGILRFLVKPGNLVQRGQKIARIYNAFGKVTETIFAQQDGIVIGLTDTAIAFPGSPVMAFGIK